MKISKKALTDKRIWAGIGLILVVIIGGLIWKNTRTTDVTEDFHVSFSGYNGSGRANYSTDTINKNIMTALLKKEGVSDDDIKLIQVPNSTSALSTDLLSKLQTVTAEMALIKVTFSKTNELSNGDKFTVTVKSDLKKAKIKDVKHSYTVKGLKKIKKISANDVKDNLKFKFIGYNGMGSVNITGKKYKGRVIRVETNGILENGDEIRIDAADLVPEGNGEKFVGTHSFKVKVSGLTDLTKVPNLDDVIKLNNDFEKNSIDNDSATVELIHSYATSSDYYDVLNTDGDTADNSAVSVGSESTVPEITIFNVYKVTRKDIFEETDVVDYESYGISSLTLNDDGKFDLASKNTNSDGVSSTSYDSLEIIQKNLESTAILLK